MNQFLSWGRHFKHEPSTFDLYVGGRKYRYQVSIHHVSYAEYLAVMTAVSIKMVF